MLARLKRQFVLITVALTGLVLVGVLGSTLISSWQTQRDIIDGALERGLDDDLDHMPMVGGMGPRENDKRRSNLLAISVDVTADGVVIKSSRTPLVIDSSLLSDVVEEALSSDADRGTMRDLHIAWARRLYLSEDDYLLGYNAAARVVIVDTSAMDRAFAEQLRTDALITAGALAALVHVAYFLAGWALRPVAKAWDEQRRFVADASHELKTPLAVIIANTDILLTDEGVATESRRWVESTAEEAHHMKGLVNELLELARADESATGGAATALHREDIDFSELVESSALEFDAVAFERGCLIDSEVAEGIHIQADRTWMTRMVKILIDNACKYAAEGSTIKVSLRRTSGHTVLSVNNAGTPIDPADIEHVFERFYRSDKARTRGAGGFGLGLAIAKSIIEAHGGQIGVTSTEAEGTTFTVTL